MKVYNENGKLIIDCEGDIIYTKNEACIKDTSSGVDIEYRNINFISILEPRLYGSDIIRYLSRDDKA